MSFAGSASESVRRQFHFQLAGEQSPGHARLGAPRDIPGSKATATSSKDDPCEGPGQSVKAKVAAIHVAAATDVASDQDPGESQPNASRSGHCAERGLGAIRMPISWSGVT
jgi:hypothetical protein